jgi:HEAT repeat protein
MLRGNSLEALSPAGPRLQAPLAAGLVDPNEGVRAIAATLVGEERVRPLVASVRPLLTDESPLVRASAIYALRSVGAEVDPTPLGALLLESPEPGVRAHAAFLFGELGDRSALPLLRQALHEEIPGATEQQERLVWLQVAEAMVKLGDRDRLEGIRAALYPARPEEFEIAVLATQILGRLGDRSSMAQLINLSEYTQNGRTVPAELRLAVADAAARMGRKEGWFIAESYLDDPDALRRSQAALVLGQTGRDRDLATLAGLLDDPNPLVRAAAAGSILTITSPAG